MKTISKFLFIAALSALAFASCDKAENEFLNPKGTPVKFVLSGDKEFDGAKAAVKVTADVPVPADVTIKLSLDAAATIKADNITFPSLIIAKGETEASGYMEFDPTGLKPGTTFKIIVKGTIDGVELAQKLSLSYTTEAEPEPVLAPITIDGDMSDWAEVTNGLLSVDGPYYEFKASCDANNIYFYCRRSTSDPALWKKGYFYFDMDIDSNPNTGVEKDAIVGLETWMFLYFFLKDEDTDAPIIASAPAGERLFNGEAEAHSYQTPENSCKGIIGEDEVELEVAIPRADFGVRKGDSVTIYTWGNKSASNFKTEPLYLTFND